MADLVIQDSYHLTTADEVGVQGGVHTIATLNDAYHVVTSDDRRLVSPHFRIGTDPLNPPKLPALEVSEASFGNRISVDATLPGIEIIDCRFGSRLDDGNLPVMSLSAAISGTVGITVSGNLPAGRLSARTGARMDSGKLPAMEIEATISGGRGITVDKKLPALSLSATISGPREISLDADLPPLKLTAAVISAETGITVSGKLPALRVSAEFLAGMPITVSGTLPALEVSATVQSGSITVDVDLPALVAAIGTGKIAAASGVISDGSRYNDYFLRHAR